MTRISSAEDVIKALGLEPLRPEGGYYRETYRANELVPQHALPPRYDGDRLFSSAIYYLLAPGTRSALHRLLTDEVYHFYLGDPVHMLLMHPGGASETVTLGHDIAGGQRVQAVVPRGVWQGSYLLPGGRFALMGTTMAPGFEHHDYESGDRAALVAAYPDQAALITQLTS